MSLYINWKRTKGDKIDRNWPKTQYNTATIFTKCNVFFCEVHRFILLFLSKNRTKGVISDRNWAKTPYTTEIIFINSYVFYARYIVKRWYFTHKLKKNKRWVFSKKLSKNTYNTATIFTNCYVFMRGTSSFFICFCQKIEKKGEILHIKWKRTKGEIFDRNWAKAPCNTATIFTKCNVFYARYIVFICCFLSKNRTKGENSYRIWVKTPYTSATIFTKCNVCYARYIVKRWDFTQKNEKNKRWVSRQKLSENPI